MNPATLYSFVFVSLICMSPYAVADDIAPVVGSWVANGASCRSIKNMDDEGVMKISKREIQMYESTCKIRSTKKIGSSIAAVTICDSEGEASRNTIVFDLISKNELRVKDGFTYVRCP